MQILIKKIIIIQRSLIGDTLETYSLNKLNYPVIENVRTNHKLDLAVYDLTYGSIPKMYTLEFEFVVGKLLESRTDLPYDILEGELEMMFLAYWKLETQDLKKDNEKIQRLSRKQAFSFIMDIILKHFKIALNGKYSEKKYILDLLENQVKTLVLSNKFDDANTVTGLSLVHFKKRVGAFISSLDIPVDLFELVVGFFVDFK